MANKKNFLTILPQEHGSLTHSINFFITIYLKIKSLNLFKSIIFQAKN